MDRARGSQRVPILLSKEEVFTHQIPNGGEGTAKGQGGRLASLQQKSPTRSEVRDELKKKDEFVKRTGPEARSGPFL